ncbi:MAG: ABC transporter permease subunit [Lentisphaeria bacterium]|jgi:phosphate transport system permease protein
MDKRRLHRVKLTDAIARRLIAVGGIGVIGCVLLMLLLIVGTALPLFRPASATRLATLAPERGQADLLVAGTDDLPAIAYAIHADGQIRFRELATGRLLETRPLRDGAPPPGARIIQVETAAPLTWSLLWSDGAASRVKLSFGTAHAAGASTPTFHLDLTPAPPLAAGDHATAGAVRDSDDALLRASLLADGRLELRRRPAAAEADAEAAVFTLNADHAEKLTAFTVNQSGSALYAGTADGRLLHWEIDDDGVRLVEQLQAFLDRRAITALGLVFGDLSLAVGDDRGEVSTWTPIPLYGPGSEKRLILVHRLQPHAAPVTAFRFTVHDKGIVSLAADGTANLGHMTSERHLLALPANPPLTGLQLSAKGDTFCGTDGTGAASFWHVRNPHPEVSWKVLFGKVMYENYEKPEWVWQSSSANDDSEPKFSFVPLLFGSLKGTLYAMAFAVPLALFGALYTSQFTTPAVRGMIKPAVEVMAAIPSVVIGFLAALWLAPRLEGAIIPLFLFLAVLPAALVLFLLLWAPLRRTPFGRRVERGYEFLGAIPVLLLAAWLCLKLGPWVEARWFGGDFNQWLFQELGARIDPRNSIVIAFALGFAVIPLIFTIAEDALSNVPQSLKAASLALGASRWQTVWRVVLPSASPGVFAAMIIGFGRAVGETMIVLMATGNTPVLDWGPFSGMRTLAANIAVEIPEAPVGGTLYRTLFLSAVLLFLLTSVLNTAAELIRHRLRKKYGY